MANLKVVPDAEMVAITSQEKLDSALSSGDLTAIEIDGGYQPWAEIQLRGGYGLRIQVNIQGVYMVNGLKSPDGLPVFSIAATNNLQAFLRAST